MPITTTTTSTRPVLTESHAGAMLFDTDTNQLIIWDGTIWYVFEPTSTIPV